jgi:hypothetical protein
LEERRDPLVTGMGRTACQTAVETRRVSAVGIVPADKTNQLPQLVRLRLATPVLKVELLGNAGAAEDVVAARHPQLLETHCLQQLLRRQKRRW